MIIFKLKYICTDCMMSQQSDDLSNLLKQYATTRKRKKELDNDITLARTALEQQNSQIRMKKQRLTWLIVALQKDVIDSEKTLDEMMCLKAKKEKENEELDKG